MVDFNLMENSGTNRIYFKDFFIVMFISPKHLLPNVIHISFPS